MSFKRLNIMTQLKNLIILVLLIPVIQLNKLAITQKLVKLKVKFIILNILLLKNLTSESFARNWDIPVITDFVKKTDFDNKLISFNKRITSNKTRDTKIKTELDDLEKTVNVISTKELTKDVDTLDKWSKNLHTDFTLGNCLFEAVELTKNADPGTWLQHTICFTFTILMERWRLWKKCYYFWS